MEERKISTGGSCFLVRDDTLKDAFNSHIYTWLKKEGFESWKSSGTYCLNWIYINTVSKIYAPGIPGIKIADVVGNHAITFDEFLTIYNIYQKYKDLSLLRMNIEEQKEFNKKYAKHLETL